MKQSASVRRNMLIGILAATVASLIFGVTPVLVKLAYDGGSNGVTMTFMRGLFALPVLHGISRAKRFSLRIPKKGLPAAIAILLFGSFLTTLALYSSYAYISVGMATVLHYIFPVLVMLGGVLLFHERIAAGKIIALVVGFAGVSTFFTNSGANGLVGILLASGSGLFYAIWLLGMNYSALRELNPVQTAYFSALTAVAAAFVFGIATDTLRFRLTYVAWGYTVIVSLLISVVAISMLKLAIEKCGATTTSIICMLEPVSGVFFGWLLLGETLSAANLAGCVFILASVAMVTLFSALKKNKPLAES